MTLREMIDCHPQASKIDHDALAHCIDECFSCAATCTRCADACLAEEMLQELVRCIRLDLDCADICDATGRMLTRQTAFEPQLARKMFDAPKGAAPVSRLVTTSSPAA